MARRVYAREEHRQNHLVQVFVVQPVFLRARWRTVIIQYRLQELALVFLRGLWVLLPRLDAVNNALFDDLDIALAHLVLLSKRHRQPLDSKEHIEEEVVRLPRLFELSLSSPDKENGELETLDDSLSEISVQERMADERASEHLEVLVHGKEFWLCGVAGLRIVVLHVSQPLARDCLELREALLDDLEVEGKA